MPKPRELAVSILDKIEKGSYGNLLLSQYLTPDIAQKDRALITELVNGVVQNLLRIDYIISQFSKIHPSKMSSYVRNALRISVYQIFFLDRVPEFAAVNESVNIVKKFNGAKAANFTNAVLRNIIRNKDNIYYPDRDKNFEEYISVYYSFPLWLVKRWVDLFGRGFTESLCISLNERPKLCIRVNTLLITREELENRLRAEGVLTVPGLYCDEALYILDSPPITALESFKEGLFIPQDESSIIASLAAGVKSGEKILDAAAAPGGKTTYMAAIMQNKGEIIAWDVHPHRVQLIKENCRRLKVDIVMPEVKDAKVFNENLADTFDKVIIDVPCSGTGVIRRKPDIKWSKKPEDIISLKSEQEKILSTCARYVKPNGILIYSTCSIDPEENEKNIEAFLAKNDSFVYDDLRNYVPESLKEDLKDHWGYLTLYPNLHEIDGFFIARLKKVKPLKVKQYE